MSDRVSILSPELLYISDGERVYYGAQQGWYPVSWQRKSGCGPTACSHLLWYLSQSRPECGALCTYEGSYKDGFLQFMQDVWRYVTPGRMGVNTTGVFAKGAERYAQDRGVNLSSRILNIPIYSRPEASQLMDFITRSFSDNLPVAFLNLSNGTLRNLDSWHWVTLVSAYKDPFNTVMFDQGLRDEIDLGRWLHTTSLGGGLVCLEPNK